MSRRKVLDMTLSDLKKILWWVSSFPDGKILLDAFASRKSFAD